MSNIQPTAVNTQSIFNAISNTGNFGGNIAPMSQFAFGAPPPSFSNMSNMLPQQQMHAYIPVQPSFNNGDPFSVYPQQQQMMNVYPNIGGGFGYGASPSTFGMPSSSISYSQPRMVQHNALAIKQAQSRYKAATTYEKIKEYTDTTYNGINKPKTNHLLPVSLFWA